MKKLILLLLFIPLVSFGQEWKRIPSTYQPKDLYNRSESLKIDFTNTFYKYEAENGSIKYTTTSRKSDPNANYSGNFFDGTIQKTTIVYPYNNGDSCLCSNNLEYRDGYLFYKKSTKGSWLYPNPDRNDSMNVEVIMDGFYTLNLYKSTEIFYEAFYIFNYKIAEKLHSSFEYKYYVYPDVKTQIYGIGDVYSDQITINEYDIEAMVNVFLYDYINSYIQLGLPEGKKINLESSNKSKPSFFEDFKNMFNIKAIFESLEGDALALAYGFNDDKNIIIKIDPEKWAKASSAKRWYTLYHELGHDVLNFEHGQGGKMMFNFADRDYTWETFEKDRNYMFKKAIENAKKRNKLF